MLVSKEKVNYELDKLKDLFNELLVHAAGDKPFMQLMANKSDEDVTNVNGHQYLYGDLAEVDEVKLEACITRVNNEMCNLMKAVKSKL